jgi:histidinol-phosphate aminotransferase
MATRATGAEGRSVAAHPGGHAQPYGHDLAAMAAAVDDQTTVIFVANPNNPTGTWCTRAELLAFLDAVPSQVAVVLDEAYFEYVDEAEYPDGMSLLSKYSNLIVTRTFSKAYGLAALRVGYAVSHSAVADLLNRVRQPFNVNHLAQVAAVAALADQNHLAKACEINRAGLKQLNDGLRGMGFRPIPSVGNFLTFRIPHAAAIYDALLRQGVIVRPVWNYGLVDSLRISVGLAEQNDRALIALKRARQEVGQT